MRTMYFRHELEDMYEEQLNDCFGMVSICGHNYDAGHALRLIDEISFNCGVNKFEGEEFVEVYMDTMTESEIEHYCATERTVMYCRHDEVDEEA